VLGLSGQGIAELLNISKSTLDRRKAKNELLNLGTTPSISVLEALVHVSSLSAPATLENVLIPVEFEDALISVSVV
jgi:hypothetical protein